MQPLILYPAPDLGYLVPGVNVNTTRNKMKYKIISHDDYWHITTVMVAEDEAGLDTGVVIPVSLTGLSSVEEFESRIYLAYSRNRPPSVESINASLLSHVTSNVSSSLPLSDVITTTNESTVTNFSNSWSIHPESTLTNNQQIIPDEVI